MSERESESETKVVDVFEEENARWPLKVARLECTLTEKDTFLYQTVGLGEPYPPMNGPEVGIGCELFMESKDKRDVPFMGTMLRELSEFIITNQEVLAMVEKYKFIPVDLAQIEVPFPDGFREYREHKVTVLVGAPVPKDQLDFKSKTNSVDQTIPRIPVKLLTRTQLLKIRAGGSARCKKFMGEFIKSGEFHLTKIH